MKLTYRLIYACFWLLAGLPFRILYLLSDFFYFLMYRIARYRLRVVRENLQRSFPEKSKKERRKIERQFYHYLCDYMLEEVKLLRLSYRELYRRMGFENKETFLNMIEKHDGAILLIPHYANFEWIMGIVPYMQPEDIAIQVYKPLHNLSLDTIFMRIRSRFGGYNIPKHLVSREIIKLRREGKRIGIALITDQSPNIHEAHYWTTFLNQETVFMDGGERLAKLLNFPVLYCELKRLCRGHCNVYFDLLTENPKEMKAGEITEMFAHRLEETIRKEPPYWFWSHKRWKLKRADIASEHASKAEEPHKKENETDE